MSRVLEGFMKLRLLKEINRWPCYSRRHGCRHQALRYPTSTRALIPFISKSLSSMS